MHRIVLVFAALAGILIAASSASTVSAAPAASAAAECRNVITRYIHATSVRTDGGLRCAPARKVLRRYFRKVIDSAQVEGGCAHQRFADGCAVGRFLCFASASGVRGRCTDGVGTVRFRERDFGPEP